MRVGIAVLRRQCDMDIREWLIVAVEIITVDPMEICDRQCIGIAVCDAIIVRAYYDRCICMLALPFWKMRKTLRNALGIMVIDKDTPIGMHIRKKRLELQMNQGDAAKELGVTEACVWLWENLQAKPQIHYMPSIIAFLGYSPFTFDLFTLAGRIKNYRTLHGLNSEAFGKLVGVSDSTIGEWENGSKPKADRLNILEKIIGK